MRRPFVRGVGIILLAVLGRFVALGDTWHVWRGVADPSTNTPVWNSVDYAEVGWTEAPLPLTSGGFDQGGTVLRDMRGNYTTVYLRTAFVLDDPASVNQLAVRLLASDGFAVWLNGHELGRENVPLGNLTHTNKALTNGGEENSSHKIVVAELNEILRQGTNVLAVLGLSWSKNDSTFYLDARLEVELDRISPRIDRTVPESGSVVREFNSFEVLTSEPVLGVDAGDLLINGIAATNLVAVGPDDYVFEFPNPPPGAVEIKLRADSGITDRARKKNPLAAASWSVRVDTNSPIDGIQISEFMADNGRSLRDEDGDRGDWIEIRNTGTTPVSLKGWGLSADPTRPLAWQFPAVVVPKGAYLVVYASGKNRTQGSKYLHTNFKLPKAGGYLALALPSGQPFSVFAEYPPQREDVSYGRVPGNSQQIGFFPQATPGAGNASSGSGFAPAVEFSERSRTYRQALTLALRTTNSNATIRYTTNHQEPDERSPLYTGPWAVTKAVEIRARAFLPGLFPGPIRSETYLPLDDDAVAFSSELPVLLITDFDAGRPALGSPTLAHLQVYAAGSNLFGNSPQLTSRATIAARGSSTAWDTKVSMKLELQDELGNDQDAPLLGLPKDSDWILYAPNLFEPILIHNPLAHQLSRDIGRYSPRTRFVVLYLVTQGDGPVQQSTHYYGIYVLEEQIKTGSNRVDIEKLLPETTRPDLITGGYLFKIDRWGPSDGYIPTPHQTVLVTDPKGFELNPEQGRYLNTYFEDFDQALYSSNFRDPVKGYRAFVDVPSWIDHHLLNVVTFNVDALRLSAYFYKPRGQKLHFGPLWDFDRALRSTDGRDENPRTWRSAGGDLGTDFFNYPWWDRLFRDPDFFQQYIDRYDELRNNQFGLPHLFQLVDSLTTEVRSEQPREFKKWRHTPRGGFDGEIRSLKLWLSNRLDFIDTQFVRPPIWGVTPSAMTLNFVSRSSTITYYTIDGTDPREAGGGISPRAFEFSQPLTLATNTLVIARAFDPNHKPKTGVNNPPLKSLWSAPVRRSLVLQPLPLVISEIMFHPADPGPGVDPQDLEFIELVNRGHEPLDLRGVGVTGGIQFTFDGRQALVLAPKERVILVHNPVVFLKYYPETRRIAGVFTNSLGNGGDQLRLTGPWGETIFDFWYDPNWQAAADGAGRSLVLNYEGVDAESLGQALVWRASAFGGGSPGYLDPVSLPNMDLQITRTGTELTLRFEAGGARSYRVWTRNDPGLDPWRLDQSFPALDQESVKEIKLPFGEQLQLFRVTSP